MIFSSLKGRLRPRTCVASFKFQSALDLKNRLGCLSDATKRKVSRTHDFLRFEESARFSHMYRNFQVSECVGFEELAPFSYS